MSEEILPLSILDFVGIEHGESPHSSIAGAVGIAQAVETAGIPAGSTWRWGARPAPTP